MTGSMHDQDRPRDARDDQPAMQAPGQGLDAPPGVAPAGRAAADAERPDEEVKPPEDVALLLKEGAGAPDAADIEDPETQL